MTAATARRRRYTPRRPDLEKLYELLPLMARGMSYAAIGAKLHLTAEGVRSRATVLYDQLGADNTAHAVAIAYQRGLLRADPRHLENAARHLPTCTALTPRACNCGADHHRHHRSTGAA
jgi:DNA-binding CsgD family transcriptional regulator